MAAMFGVSRTPIREAMQSLSLLGVIDVSPRRGATVQALPVESVVDLAILSGTMAPERSVDDILAFRLAMESAIADLAAANAGDEDLATLQSIVADNGAAVANRDRDAAIDADIRFHAAIAEASGNVVFISVAHVLNGLLVELRKTTGGIPGASDASLAEHRAILSALERRDGAAARQAAAEHIANTRARYHARASEPAG
jgi:DNA-binding FadR family transcriptional regulator